MLGKGRTEERSDHLVVPIPSYQTILVEALHAFDTMPPEDRQLALAFLHIQLAKACLIERRWELAESVQDAYVLGREA